MLLAGNYACKGYHFEGLGQKSTGERQKLIPGPFGGQNSHKTIPSIGFYYRIPLTLAVQINQFPTIVHAKTFIVGRGDVTCQYVSHVNSGEFRCPNLSLKLAKLSKTEGHILGRYQPWTKCSQFWYINFLCPTKRPFFNSCLGGLQKLLSRASFLPCFHTWCPCQVRLAIDI